MNISNHWMICLFSFMILLPEGGLYGITFSHSSKIVVKCIKIILMHSCFVFYFHKQVMKHIIDSCCVVGKVRFCIWPQVICCFVYLHISIKCTERNVRQIPMQIRFSQRHVIWWANHEPRLVFLNAFLSFIMRVIWVNKKVFS